MSSHPFTMGELGPTVSYYPRLAMALGPALQTRHNYSEPPAMLLSNLIFWTGKQRDPDGWIYKTEDDLETELGLARRKLLTARGKLLALGLIDYRRQGSNGVGHYRVRVESVRGLLRQPDRAPSREPDRAPSREPDRAPSREPDRAPSREPNKGSITTTARQQARGEEREELRTELLGTEIDGRNLDPRAIAFAMERDEKAHAGDLREGHSCQRYIRHIAIEEHRKLQEGARVRQLRDERQRVVDACRRCDNHGRLLSEDGAAVEPVVFCSHDGERIPELGRTA